MAADQVRGSSRLREMLFESKTPSHEDLLRAIAGAREDFKVLRWWKYGQPAIDRIKATLDVQTERVGGVIQELISGHGVEVQVGLDVFPYGLPQLEGVQDRKSVV